MVSVTAMCLEGMGKGQGTQNKEATVDNLRLVKHNSVMQLRENQR